VLIATLVLAELVAKIMFPLALILKSPIPKMEESQLAPIWIAFCKSVPFEALANPSMESPTVGELIEAPTPVATILIPPAVPPVAVLLLVTTSLKE
jgi:hypothetical protein